MPIASANSYIALGLMLGIVAFIVMLYLRRKRLERGVVEFRIRHRLQPAATVPAGLFAALGTARWSSYSGELSTARGPLPIFWLEGFTTGSTLINGVPTTTISPLVGVALPSRVVDARFEARIDASRKQASWWAENFLRNAQSPVRAEHLEGGLFFLVWTVCINPAHYEKALVWVQATLAESGE